MGNDQKGILLQEHLCAKVLFENSNNMSFHLENFIEEVYFCKIKLFIIANNRTGNISIS